MFSLSKVWGRFMHFIINKNVSAKQALLRTVNQRAVLNNIYLNENTSRTELAKALRMSKPAIASNLKDLLELGIVMEIGEGETTQNGGRKPILLNFNKSHKYFIVIDLNYKNPIFALGNLKSEIVRELTVEVSKRTSEESLENILINAISLLINLESIAIEKVACIGVSSPGIFDPKGNLLGSNPQFKGFPWHKINYINILEKEFGTKTIVMNDINAAAIAEWSRVTREIRNLLYVSCGVGIGVRMIFDSKLYEGKNYTAGEIYNNIDPEKYRKGITFEDTVCMNTLIQRVNADARNDRNNLFYNKDEITFQDVVDAYKQNDSYIMGCVREIGFEIGCALVNMINLMEIEKIVLGGEYLVFKDVLLDEFNRIFRRNCNHMPAISAADLGSKQGIYGLLFEAREWYFDYICNN